MERKKLVAIVVVLVIALVFFFPKPAGRGSCGMCVPGQYKWTEQECFGLKNVFTETRCADCAPQMDCHGIPYGEETCYTSSEEPRQEVSCE
ncbi:hypothetical protein ACFLQ2_03600 [archaeon]